MEEEGMEEGSRWRSFSPSERDQRMQTLVRDYDPYETDSRHSTRSGHYADSSQSSRGPSSTTMQTNQQAAGWRVSRHSVVAQQVNRKEGPNWVLLAGGALVAALGVWIVKKPKASALNETMLEKANFALAKDRVQQSGLSFASTRRESTGSRTSDLSAESPYSDDPYMLACTQPQSLSGSRVGSESGDEDCAHISPPAVYYSHFSKGSNHSNRTVITPTSPPGSYRGAETSATECNDPLALSPPARVNFSLRRDMVHRLRQQLKSRDEMILDMQAQISDQERTISLHEARCIDLEGRLQVANKTLFESDREIQRLRIAVAEYLASHVTDSGNWDLSMKEARRLADELRSREDERRELERLASLRIKEHELVVQRLQDLEAELEEARESDFGKNLLLEAYEVEHESLEDRVDNLKRLVETRTPERSPTSSMIGRKSLSGALGMLRLEHEQRGHKEEIGIGSSKTDDFSPSARSLVRSFSTLFERKMELSPRAASEGRAKCKTDETSSNGDVSDESETDDGNPHLSEKLLSKLQEEVEQLSCILADHSDMISEKRLETTHLVDEFQRHNALISDIQKKLDENVEGRPELQDQDFEDHSQYLSFSNDSSSAAQVQELSHKLEQIEKQQRVEEEIAELSKHQVKIAELTQRVEKLLTKCKNLQDGRGRWDPTISEQANKMAAAGFELAKQLALQEGQTRRTSREVQRLSASFQLSSPYVPRSKKEELRKLLQDTRSESLSPPSESVQDGTNISRLVSVLQSRFTTWIEGKPKESGDILFDPEISVSSAEPATAQSEGAMSAQIREQYVYRPGFSGRSTRKSRRGFSVNSGQWKDQSVGAKRRIVRGVRKSVPREDKEELVQSDSNSWVDRARPHVGSADEQRLDTLARGSESQVSPVWKRVGGGYEIAGAGECSVKGRLVPSAAESRRKQTDGETLVGLGSPGGRRQSGGSFSDSSAVRIGSPTSADSIVNKDTSIESTESSFGRFLFDMEKGNEVYAVNHDEVGQDDVAVGSTTPPLSPPMMARLVLEDSSPSVSQDCRDSFGSNASGLSVDTALGVVQQTRRGKDSRSSPGSSISIGSSFDELLDNTLDDLVRLCSTPSTPVGTPESSFMSSHSDMFRPG